MDVHVRDLRYFLAVAQDLHFTRAAERLFVSQPALSKQIRLLEKQLGVELFIRDRRRVRLTDAGSALLPHANSVVAAWDEAAAAVESYRAEESHSLVIGMSTSPGRGLLPAIRARVREHEPKVNLAVRQFGWEDPTAGLADGSTDLAFVWLPLPANDDFQVLVVAEEDLIVALPEQHPLADHPVLTFPQITDEAFLALPETAGDLRDYWLLAAHRDTPARIGAVVHSTEETYEALVGRLGIVLLAAGNAPLLDRPGIVLTPLQGAPRSRLALAWRATDTRESVARYAQACADVMHRRP